MSFFDDIQQTLAARSIHFAFATEFRTIDDLLPKEREAVAGACDSRQREFATGRWCARRLLDEMGAISGEIGRGKDNEAVWPTGICGSITHTKGACCVIASFLSQFRSVGIDVEKASRQISEPARRLFLNADETAWINALPAISPDVYLTIFSIKESMYKMLYPLVKTVIPFSAVSVRPFENDDSFSCHVNRDLSRTILSGNVLDGLRFKNENWLLTVAALDAEQP
jgi:4'-phosphopantetheinyl transferase EntD